MISIKNKNRFEIDCADFYLTMNQQRSYKEVSRKFDIPYPTINQWKQTDITERTKERVGKIILIYLTRINIESTFAIMEKYLLPANNNYKTIAQNLLVSKREKDYEYLKDTRVEWKKNIFALFAQINKDLFLAQTKVVLDIFEKEHKQYYLKMIKKSNKN